MSTVTELYGQTHNEIERYVLYYEEEQKKEIERVTGWNLWLKQLRDSLK